MKNVVIGYQLSFRGFVRSVELKFEWFIRSYVPAACTKQFQLPVTTLSVVSSMFMYYETIRKHLISNTNGNINDNKRSYSQHILIILRTTYLNFWILLLPFVAHYHYHHLSFIIPSVRHNVYNL